MEENGVFKSGKISGDVAPRTVGILKTSIQFSTQDKGTAKLIFSLSKDGLPLSLSSAATGNIFLRMADGSVFEKNVSIVDQINGKLEYVLQEEISHPGLAKGELNIYYTNGQAMSVCKFSFNIDASLKDQNIVPLAEYYVKDFNTLQTDIEQRAASINETVDELQLKVDEFESTAITQILGSLLQLADTGMDIITLTGDAVYLEKDFPIIIPEIDDTPRIQRAIDYAKASGMLTVVFALKSYNTSSTLKLYGGVVLVGQHRKDTKIISQGDIPTIASEGYFTAGVGSGDIAILNLGVYPRGVTSKTKYAIEMVNTYNTTIKNCYINESIMATSDVGGIRFSKDSTYAGSHFVNAVRECQLQNASIVMESTDSYITENEIWADKRAFGVHLVKSSQFVRGNQIVGSALNGSIWISDTKDNFDIELIRITDNYFDGNNQGLDTGAGIIANKMKLSRITLNDFWLNKDEGIKLTSCHSNSIVGNQFENNNRRDAGKDDIYMDTCAANTITGNTFKRDIVHAVKGSPIRTVNSPVDKNIIIGNTVYFTSFYNSSSFSNKDVVRFNNGIPDKFEASGHRAYLASNTSAAVGAETKLTFDTEDYDLMNEYSVSTGIFTALTTGLYTIAANVQFNAQVANNRTILLIYKNGAGYTKIYDGSTSIGGNSSAAGSLTVKLNAGDTISIYYYSSGNAGIVGGTKETAFTVSKVADI